MKPGTVGPEGADQVSREKLWWHFGNIPA